MISFFLMFKRKPGMSLEDFRNHYESVHVGLAEKYVGHLFLDYTRNYVNSTSHFLESSGGYIEESEDTTYDVITHIVFKDKKTIDEFFQLINKPDIHVKFREDEDNFMDRSSVQIHICEGVRTWVGDDLR